ncbi:hypothetical protein GMOD_00007618 [Pyrenophora seminiperda CCB06]|uniref:Uncharacterized protein n=1 Tax=Pyrenophora seminiperda CCB06 TaxID=1302712 RepID=A0A3M7ME13_9PLEO|nr:hypothetical protein GMOD_00007618 [Pyrenophora seminiperda CCB06]
MCYKLLQVYDCGHENTVSTTPCPHAIATGQQIPQVANAMTTELSRPSSVVSSMTPVAARRSDVQDLPSQRATDTHAHPEQLRVATPGTQEGHQNGAPVAFRFVAQGQEPLPSPPSHSYRSRWMHFYRDQHPNSKQEDDERLSGLLKHEIALAKIISSLERLEERLTRLQDSKNNESLRKSAMYLFLLWRTDARIWRWMKVKG